jgi:hypothetical protein
VLHGGSADTYRFPIYTRFNKGVYSLFSGSGVELDELENAITQSESLYLPFSYRS